MSFIWLQTYHTRFLHVRTRMLYPNMYSSISFRWGGVSGIAWSFQVKCIGAHCCRYTAQQDTALLLSKQAPTCAHYNERSVLCHHVCGSGILVCDAVACQLEQTIQCRRVYTDELVRKNGDEVSATNCHGGRAHYPETICTRVYLYLFYRWFLYYHAAFCYLQ